MKIIKTIVLISLIISSVISINTSKKDNKEKEKEKLMNSNSVNQETSFLQVGEQISSMNQATAGSTATSTSEAASKAGSTSTTTAKLGMRERAAKAVEDAEKIAQQFKKEIEEYAKIKKNRKPVKVDNSQEANELEFIQKNSMSKFLPEDINQKLNDYRLE